MSLGFVSLLVTATLIPPHVLFVIVTLAKSVKLGGLTSTTKLKVED